MSIAIFQVIESNYFLKIKIQEEKEIKISKLLTSVGASALVIISINFDNVDSLSIGL